MVTASVRSVRKLVIVFVDLSHFARDAEGGDDERTADALDRYYERIGEAAVAGGGRVVKVIGDGALLAFPVERADDAVLAVLELRTDVDRMMSKQGWGSCLVTKIHVGDVVCGPFGPREDKRFDIIGGQVNVAARLPTRQLAVSAEAFRALSPALRQRFKKHTPPVTYIPLEDKRPSAVAKG